MAPYRTKKRGRSPTGEPLLLAVFGSLILVDKELTQLE